MRYPIPPQNTKSAAPIKGVLLAVGLLIQTLDAAPQPSLAEDPTLVDKAPAVGSPDKHPWRNRSPEELRSWAREHLHHKLTGSRIIDAAQHPEWAWFRKSGLGLFLHWGPASLPPANGDAWAMVVNEHRQANGLLHLPEEMFAAAETWNPQKYDPGKWMAAASKAGFGYAVLTTRHHDGYCLWPTKYGTWDTGEKMNGRDLVRDYVDACRENNIRIGFYYSGPNWHAYHTLKDFSHPPAGYNYKHEKVGLEAGLAPLMGGGQLPPEFAKKEQAESHGQVTELLTNYGNVDMLWWDGSSIMQENEVHSLQPRTFVARGNIATPEGRHHGESRNVKVTNEAGWWWELCQKTENTDTPYWHYNPVLETNHWDASRVLSELVRCRALGGNLLANVTPRPDGTIMDWFYDVCDEMAGWMAHSREAVYDVDLDPPLPMLDKTDNAITVRGDAWYAMPDAQNTVEICDVAKPSSVTLLRTGDPIQHTFENGTLRITVPEAMLTNLPDMVKIAFAAVP